MTFSLSVADECDHRRAGVPRAGRGEALPAAAAVKIQVCHDGRVVQGQLGGGLRGRRPRPPDGVGVEGEHGRQREAAAAGERPAGRLLLLLVDVVITTVQEEEKEVR